MALKAIGTPIDGARVPIVRRAADTVIARGQQPFGNRLELLAPT
jgi:hypothetical protein